MKKALYLTLVLGGGGRSAHPKSVASGGSVDIVKLDVHPQIQHIVDRPVKVELVIRITNPDDLWCAGIHIWWGDGESSFNESDCDPDEEKPERFVYRKTHWYKTSGELTLEVAFTKAGKVIRRETVIVRIIG